MDPAEGTMVELSGWGETEVLFEYESDVLLEITQPIGNTEDCDKYFLDNTETPSGVPEKFACVDTSNGQSTCYVRLVSHSEIFHDIFQTLEIC